MAEKEVVQLDKVKLSWLLFALRLGIFIVIGMWSLDKLVNPGHAAAVFAKFYQVEQLGEMTAYVLGALQVILAMAFLLGYQKNTTYLLVLLIHLCSTLVSFPLYLDGFNNLLFFAAWPMLSACLVLYFLRDVDTRFCLK